MESSATSTWSMPVVASAWLVDWIAGSFAGVGEIAVGHPLDTLKARVQTNPSKPSYVQMVVNIFRNEQIIGFYKGSLPAIMNSSLCSALLFTTFGTSQTWVRSNLSVSDDWQPFVSGTMTGLVMGAVVTPLDRAKLMMQTNTQRLRPRLSTQLVESARREGVRGLFKGLNVTLVRDMPGYGVYFGVYHFFRSKSIQHYGSEDKLPIWAQMSVGGLSGMCSWFMCYPVDVVKSRIQSNKTSTTKILPNVIQIWNETQPKGLNFFKGVSITLVRAFPVNAMSFTIYEIVKKLISNE